jgi:hypothetical protein
MFAANLAVRRDVGANHFATGEQSLGDGQTEPFGAGGRNHRVTIGITPLKLWFTEAGQKMDCVLQPVLCSKSIQLRRFGPRNSDHKQLCLRIDLATPQKAGKAAQQESDVLVAAMPRRTA